MSTSNPSADDTDSVAAAAAAAAMPALGRAAFAAPQPAGSWTAMESRQCAFGPDEFAHVMHNFARHPNLNTTWLFRADILYDDGGAEGASEPSAGTKSSVAAGADLDVDAIAGLGIAAGPSAASAISSTVPRPVEVDGFVRERTLVRRLIPRNTRRDAPLEQTCVFYRGASNAAGVAPDLVRSLVVYVPHETDAARMPFYHPKVRGVAHLHEWDAAAASGTVSVHFCLFDEAAGGVHGADDDSDCKDSGRDKDSSRGGQDNCSGDDLALRLQRTAVQLVTILHKHGQGRVAGYVKRVQHDVLVPQVRSQDRYTQLKLRHAQALCAAWTLDTDPVKHVFEDLSIAAFLMELWADMYGRREDGGPGPGPAFPGFVDIGCGNGLLVRILRLEGYAGWGFDAQARKSWPGYQMEGAGPGGVALAARVLLPVFAQERGDKEDTENQCGEGGGPTPDSATNKSTAHNDISTAENSSAEMLSAADATTPTDHLTADTCPAADEASSITHDDGDNDGATHSGVFPRGTFIISNHADELTPWTPILAAASDCPFISIPCCSHDLSGARWRAPPPRVRETKNPSAYASLVDWVARIAEDCGWEVETEMLRIPSTRNTGLVGRRRQRRRAVAGDADADTDLWAVVKKHGGAGDFARNALALARSSKPRGH